MDLTAFHTIKLLNQTQTRIIKLILRGDYSQTLIAEQLGISRQYVNQLTRSLETQGLLKQATPGSWVVRWHDNQDRPYKRTCSTEAEAEKARTTLKKDNIESQSSFEKSNKGYLVWYEPSPILKQLINAEHPGIQYSACRVHNIQLKYKILNKSAPISCDHRTGYIKSWKPRGGERHKFWYPGKHNKFSITIDVHPNTLVCYLDAGQQIVSESITDAEIAAHTQLHEAITLWVKSQAAFGSIVTIDNPTRAGKQTTETHYGFPYTPTIPQAEVLGTLERWGVKTDQCYIDGSMQEKSGLMEVETHNRNVATGMDSALSAMHNIDDRLQEMITAAIPQLLNPLQANLTAIEAHINGGSTFEYQIAQQNAFITALSKQVNDLIPDLVSAVATLAQKVEDLTNGNGEKP